MGSGSLCYSSVLSRLRLAFWFGVVSDADGTVIIEGHTKHIPRFLRLGFLSRVSPGVFAIWEE
jgi:hypothetical protein